MRIGLVGAHRVGKTTLAKHPRVGLPYVDANVRAVFEAHNIRADANVDFETRFMLQNAIFDAVCENTKAGKDRFITDRTLIDVAAYFLADVQRSTVSTLPNPELVSKAIKGYVHKCISKCVVTYDALIFVRPVIQLVASDTSAGVCEGYQTHIDLLCSGMLNELALESSIIIKQIDSADMDERVELVNETKIQIIDKKRSYLT